MAETKFNNKQIAIAINHLNLAQTELTECSDMLYTALQTIEQNVENPSLHNTVIQALASLQMQDIISQRIDKLKEFLSIIDQNISLPIDEAYLKKFAWEREVDQADVDALFTHQEG